MADTLSEEQIATFQDLFSVFDEDDSGKISYKELATALRSLGQIITEEEVHAMLAEVDVDNDGTMDFPEFLKLMADKMKEPEPEDDIREAFQVMDKDGNGYLNAKELRYVLTNIGEPLTEEEVEKILADADVDGDGRIDFNEFVKMHLI
jgi:calmodulin|mmetsp:Transcript_15206/g.25741  ORF Transcript_15206/g.25741 Transcript_15206/m.25741 type:complete len:149 (-) Transcript_15206:188-634(-)|eukprot:CAMPEP_0177767518 /NCGR_PEP_ID=MMETSP0491_2-20121128/9161_1 /TAXON_ID=63592 /ORGANISM="Tetraselmis chuii, Strain PLY429" /LENGTH=148 /DNA_ID=CAMNT_0019284125 /DNA_START=263 /DNA_END=709 /DNA_ORIENTATION=+